MAQEAQVERRIVDSKTTIPIGVAISVVTGIITGYVTFDLRNAKVSERMTRIEGLVQGQQKATETVLAALNDSAKQIHRRRANAVVLLISELSRLEAHLAAWKAPGWGELSAFLANQGQTAMPQMPTGYPAEYLGALLFGEPVQGLRQSGLVVGLHGIMTEIANFNTIIASNGPPPMLGGGVGQVPRLFAPRNESEYNSLVARCVASRDALMRIVAAVKEEANMARAELVRMAAD